MGQVVHPCVCWTLAVPPPKSMVERVGQLTRIATLAKRNERNKDLIYTSFALFILWN